MTKKISPAKCIAGYVIIPAGDAMFMRRNDRSKGLLLASLDAAELKQVVDRFPLPRSCPAQSAKYRMVRKALTDFYSHKVRHITPVNA